MTLSPMAATCAQDLFAHLAHQIVIFKFASSYGEHVYALATLAKKARRLSHALSHRGGVEVGERVALLSNNPLKQVLFFWACVLMGAHPLLLESDLPDIPSILDDFDPSTILLERRSLASIEVNRLHETTSLLHMDDEELFSKLDALDAHTSPAYQPAGLEEIAFYTLLTQPSSPFTFEATPVAHGELLRHLAQHQEGVMLSGQDISLGWARLSTPQGLIAGHLLPLHAGCNHILCSAQIEHPGLWLQTIHQHRVTHTQLSFAQGRALLEQIDTHDLDALDLSSLRSLLCMSVDARHVKPRHYKALAHLLSRASLPQDIFHVGLMPPPHHLLDTIQRAPHHLDSFNLDLRALHQDAKIVRARAGQLASVKITSLGLPIWAERPWEVVIAQDPDRPRTSHGELFHRFADGEVSSLGGQIGFFLEESGELHLLGHRSGEVELDGGSIFLEHLEQVAEQKLSPRPGLAHARLIDDTHLIEVSIEDGARSQPLDEMFLDEVRAHLVKTFDFVPSLESRLRVVPGLHHSAHPAPRSPSPTQKSPPSLQEREPASMDDARPYGDVATRSILLDRSELIDMRERIEALLRLDSRTLRPRYELTINHEAFASRVLLEARYEERSLPAVEEPAHLDETEQLWLSNLDHLAPPPSTPPTPQPEDHVEHASFFEPLPGSITERLEHDYLLRPRTTAPSPMQRSFLQRFLPDGHGWMKLVLELHDLEVDAEICQLAMTSLIQQHPATRAHFTRDPHDGELTSLRVHMSGNRLYYKDLRQHDQGASAILARHALSHLESLHHQDLGGRALVYWLVLRDEHGHTLHLHAHRAVLDRQSAHALLAAWPEAIKEAQEQRAKLPEDARSLPDLDQMAALDRRYMEHLEAQQARHKDLNRSEFWATTFAHPYPHYSLRDPRFIQERRELVTRYEPPEHLRLAPGELIEGILIAAYARFIQRLIAEHHALTASSLSSLVIGIGRRLDEADEDTALLANHTLAIPLRVVFKREYSQPIDETHAMSFIKYVQNNVHQTRANALAAEHIARIANISTLVAQGVRFVYRHEEEETLQGAMKASQREALIDHPLPELNELLLVSQRQSDGALLLRFEIAEDVQLGSRSALQAFDLLLHEIRAHMKPSQ